MRRPKSEATLKIKPEESRFGLREAITYSGLMDCDKCHRITRERDLISGACELCAYACSSEPDKWPPASPGPPRQLGLF